MLGICESDCEKTPISETTGSPKVGDGNPETEEKKNNGDKGINTNFRPGQSDFLNDVRQEKIAIGK